MARIKKFEPGRSFSDVAEFAQWCRVGNYAFGFGPAPKHGGFWLSQRLATILPLIDNGRLRKAMIRREWHDEQVRLAAIEGPVCRKCEVEQRLGYCRCEIAANE
jgi:hypothetical protein